MTGGGWEEWSIVSGGARHSVYMPVNVGLFEPVPLYVVTLCGRTVRRDGLVPPGEVECRVCQVAEWALERRRNEARADDLWIEITERRRQ